MNHEYDIVEDAGTICYYKKGTKVFHREDGPAYASVDGYEAWYLDGNRHREDGPAITYDTGEEFYYLNHEQLTEEEFNERTKYDVEYIFGNIYYYKKGTDILHREDGPAYARVDGYEAWYLDGNRHREDGPAIEYADGSKAWYLNGERMSEEEFNSRMNNNKGLTEQQIKEAVKASETVGDIDISDYLTKQVGGDHYKSQTIQPWEYMESAMTEEEFKGYLRGNVLKYVSRYDKKGGLQDIDKALHYLEKLRSCL